MDDPRNPARMLMHEVLGKSGRGPAELLHVIHASICQRVGLPVHLMKIPMTPYLLNAMAAPASLTYKGSICPQPSGETDINLTDKIEKGLDISDGGCVEDWEYLLSRFPPWAQGPEPEPVEPRVNG
ncbi:hypothetical protein DUNSADRAFT_5133 [Dunaliella salina]|uniref:Uncharacterized protein n=1 Tax=Dunaliella salina TaxID=3046 RepID=A0ABQ7H7D0_DUNSA|nr:hypothetical protein DUNSADRAFT_5133 [Dunaliella salina]|eukprot:KAF5842761.1 hypothetical protein DUNSADRAFT_5133 [Dunaliella salina]